ncbi:MAG: hypothetical protein H0W72_11570 [Planctomycetes bacterium]|nr:hypothetical protein [Planctomycetota bacterium]
MRTSIIVVMALALVGCRAHLPTEPPMTATRSYDFRFGTENAGYFEISDTGREITMNAVFAMDGQTYENPFAVRHDGQRVTAYRCGDGEWQALPPGSDKYPTSAYPLLVPRVRDRLTYVAINEGSGEEHPDTELVRTGGIVTESRGGKVSRVFHVDAERGIWKIEWGGGAVSELRAGKAEALAGSPIRE